MYLLEAAEPLLSQRGRPILATQAGAGLRIGEALALRWHSVDLERGTLTVGESKTDAGVRVVDLTPALRDEIRAWKDRSGHTAPDDLVFGTERGTAHSRTNLRKRLLVLAVEGANRRLNRDGLQPIGSIGFHALRRTFASLRFAVGDDPVYTSRQIGHESALFTMNVYASAVKRRDRLTPAELKAFDRAVEWARMGTITPLNRAVPATEQEMDQKKTRRLLRVS